MHSNIAAVRDLIRDAFTAKDLRRFCYDRSAFRFILGEFGPDSSLNDMIDAVIEQSEKHALLAELLAAIQEVNPGQFERYRERLVETGTGQPVDNLHSADVHHALQDQEREIQRDQRPISQTKIKQDVAVALSPGGQKGGVPKDDKDFVYDAYISYVDQEPDRTWVWEILVPRLEDAGLRIAVSGDVDAPGIARVVNIEQGIRQAKRTIVVLSDVYLTDNMADLENVLAQSMGIQEGTYRLLPVKMSAVDVSQLPTRLSMLTTLDLAHPRRAEREFGRLVQALKGSLPHR